MEELKEVKIEDLVSNFIRIVPVDESRQDKIAKKFVGHLERTHRTTQQLVMKLISKIIKEYSESPSDPRNKASVIWAKIVSTIRNDFSYI